jgi:predicted transcriptional regulator
MVRVFPLKDPLPGDKSRSVNKPSSAETNFVKYTQVFRKLLLLNEKNDFSTTLKNIQELLSFSENIFSSPAVAESFLYFCLHGAATAWVLQTELNMPEATVYRTIKRLRALNLVGPAVKVSKIQSSKGGPRPTVWSLESATGDEVATALKNHYKLLSPKYRVAEEVAQTILDQFAVKGKEEISYRDLVQQIREMKIPFKAPDIAELAAQYLGERGVKVWR